jgi:hypothetical protein
VKVAPTGSRYLEKVLEVRLVKLQDQSKAMIREAWECVHMQAFVHVVVAQMAVAQILFVQLIVAFVVDWLEWRGLHWIAFVSPTDSGVLVPYLQAGIRVSLHA